MVIAVPVGQAVLEPPLQLAKWLVRRATGSDWAGERCEHVTRRGLLLFIALGVIWGFPYLLIRVAVRDLTPASLVFFRTASAALVLAPFSIRRGSLQPLLIQWKPILAFAAIEVAIPWLLLSRAEEHVSSALAGLLISMVPIVGALFAVITRSEHRLDVRSTVGVAVGFLGVALLVGIGAGSRNITAVGELVICATGYAIGPVIVSRYLSELPNLEVLAVAFAMTAIVYSPFALTELPTHVSGETIEAMVGLVLGCTVLAFLVFFALIAEIGPVRAIVVTYVNPAVALALGIGLLGERFTSGMVVGFPAILIGSVLTNSRSRPSKLSGSEVKQPEQSVALHPGAERES